LAGGGCGAVSNSGAGESSGGFRLQLVYPGGLFGEPSFNACAGFQPCPAWFARSDVDAWERRGAIHVDAWERRGAINVDAWERRGAINVDAWERRRPAGIADDGGRICNPGPGDCERNSDVPIIICSSRPGP
jgi:hypothetical protein